MESKEQEIELRTSEDNLEFPCQQCSRYEERIAQLEKDLVGKNELIKELERKLTERIPNSQTTKEFDYRCSQSYNYQEVQQQLQGLNIHNQAGPPQGQVSQDQTLLQQLLQTIRSPSTAEQQQQVLQILKANPQLMTAFIRHRQQASQQQLQQQQQQQQGGQGQVVHQQGPGQNMMPALNAQQQQQQHQSNIIQNQGMGQQNVGMGQHPHGLQQHPTVSAPQMLTPQQQQWIRQQQQQQLLLRQQQQQQSGQGQVVHQQGPGQNMMP